MKFTLYLLIPFLVFLRPASAQVPDGQLVYPIEPNALVIFSGNSLEKVAALRTSAIPTNVLINVEPQTDPGSALSAPLGIFYTGTGPLQMRLVQLDLQHLGVRLGSPATGRISTHHYAITGEVSYENVAANSYLEMWSYFASPAPGYPEGAYFSRTMADSGPMGKLDGTSSWREFWLPFDSSDTTSQIERLEMNLHLTGPGTVHLRDMKLMQYPDKPATPPPLPTQPVVQTSAAPPSLPSISAPLDQAALSAAYLKAQDDMAKLKAGLATFLASGYAPDHPLAAATRAQIQQQQVLLDSLQAELREQKAVSIDWESFLLGVATTGLALLAVTGLTFVSRLWQRRQHERELRRMASLDS